MKLLTPKDAPPRGAVLVIHSWWGLTPSFHAYGASLASAGFRVGLSDLFDGRTARTEAEAKGLRAAPRKSPMYKTLTADLDALRRATGTARPKVGVVGFSMGGHWAVWLSQRPEYAISATILYYAARGGSFRDCHAAILAHFAETDPWVSAGARKTMERAIRNGGCPYEAHAYPGTRHWFAETDRPAEYDRHSAHMARDRDLDHLRTYLS